MSLNSAFGANTTNSNTSQSQTPNQTANTSQSKLTASNQTPGQTSNYLIKSVSVTASSGIIPTKANASSAHDSNATSANAYKESSSYCQ